MPGPPPKGDHALTPAERAAAYRARRKAAGFKHAWLSPAAAPAKSKSKHGKAADRRSGPKQWADAVQTLADLLNQFQGWRDNLPPGLADSATAEALDAVLALRGYVEVLETVEWPKGFEWG